MSKKERFVLFVYLGAIARDHDVMGDQGETSQIIGYAERIPEEKIPVNCLNAARVFLAYVGGRSRPYKWMRGEMPKNSQKDTQPNWN